MNVQHLQGSGLRLVIPLMASEPDPRLDSDTPSQPTLWCVDSLGAYLRLRERPVTTIRGAIAALCPHRLPRVEEFDVIADGLWLVAQELEDEANPERLNLETIEAVLTDVHRNEVDPVMARGSCQRSSANQRIVAQGHTVRQLPS